MSITARDKAELGVEQNFLINGGAESGSTGWSTFNTTFSGGLPGTITSGSTFVTLSTNTSTPLAGSESLSLAVTTAAGSTGSGWISDPMTITDAYLAKVMAVQFDYNFTAGGSNVNASGTSSQTIEVWVYNVGLASWYQPAGFRSINTVGVPGRTPTITFQTDSSNSSNKNQYRVALIIRNDPAGTFTMLLDNVTFSRPVRNTGPAVIDFVNKGSSTISATTTNPTKGTVSVDNIWVAQWGDTAIIRWEFVMTGAGTAGSGTYLFNLPAGMSIDTSKITTNTTISSNNVGSFSASTGGYTAEGTVRVYNSTQLTADIVYTNGTAVGASNWSNGAMNFSAAGQWSLYAEVPISGWSSNVQMSNSTSTSVVCSVAYLASSTSFSATNIIKYDTVEFDLTGSYSPSTGLYTCNVSGVYNVEVTGFQNVSGSPGLSVYINGSQKAFLCTCSNGVVVSGSKSFQLNAGDSIGIHTDSTQTFFGGTNPSYNNLTISRLSGPSVIAANNTVAAKYGGGSTFCAGASTTIINFSIKDYDTTGSVTTGGSWKFSPPISGKYTISVYAQSVTYTPSVNLNNSNITVYKNGSADTRICSYYNNGTGSQVLIYSGSTDIDLINDDYIDLRLTTVDSITLESTVLLCSVSIKRTGD